jgi:predicted lactoylglutathione lyase
MARKLFVNIAVDDLSRSVDFYSKLGFEFDPRFTDETATCMLIGADAYAMLLVKSRFKDFITNEIADPRTHTQALLSISCESREEVDRLVGTALEGGGSPALDPMDLGFMYGWSFRDPDGHQWEPVWMDPAAVEQGPPDLAAAS